MKWSFLNQMFSLIMSELDRKQSRSVARRWTIRQSTWTTVFHHSTTKSPKLTIKCICFKKNARSLPSTFARSVLVVCISCRDWNFNLWRVLLRCQSLSELKKTNWRIIRRRTHELPPAHVLRYCRARLRSEHNLDSSMQIKFQKTRQQYLGNRQIRDDHVDDRTVEHATTYGSEWDTTTLRLLNVVSPSRFGIQKYCTLHLYMSIQIIWKSSLGNESWFVDGLTVSNNSSFTIQMSTIGARWYSRPTHAYIEIGSLFSIFVWKAQSWMISSQSASRKCL